MSPTTIPGTFILQSPASNDPLLDLNTQPSLDLQFATGKTLNDRVSGFPLVNHQRDASSGKSAGTYVGSDGLIKTSPVNLLSYSEEFDQSYYIKDPGISVTPNSITSPSGTFSATLVNVSNNGRLYANNTNVNGVCSVYIKAGSFTNFKLLNSSVDLSVPSATDGTLVSVGDGWYRFTFEQRTSARHFQIQAYPDNTHSVHTTAGSYYIWGAQLEENSTASTYVPTTNLPSGAPRFDHDPVTGESLGLLIEESRTNSVTYSEQFDQSAWIENNAAVTPNSAVSPDGNCHRR